MSVFPSETCLEYLNSGAVEKMTLFKVYVRINVLLGVESAVIVGEFTTRDDTNKTWN